MDACLRRYLKKVYLHTAGAQSAPSPAPTAPTSDGPTDAHAGLAALVERAKPYFDLHALDQSLDYPDQAKPATHPLTRFYRPTSETGTPARFQKAWADALAYAADPYSVNGRMSEEGPSKDFGPQIKEMYRKARQAHDRARDIYDVYTGDEYNRARPNATIPELIQEEARRRQSWDEAGPAVRQAEEYLEDQARHAREKLRHDLTDHYMKQKELRRKQTHL